MSDNRERHGLSIEEIEQELATELPDREAMSIVTPTPDPTFHDLTMFDEGKVPPPDGGLMPHPNDPSLSS